ncbi:MAG: ribonuclease domain-containing protein [Chloroflexota bacterium]
MVRRQWHALTLVLAAAIGLAGACVPATAPTPATVPTATPAPATSPAGPTDPASGLPVVTASDLPAEAAATIVLIQAGGPFPYRQDGTVFGNREGLLPARPNGHYREFTVPTPGSEDRGARRIVVGADGEMYWTADHYDSFAWIRP